MYFNGTNLSQTYLQIFTNIIWKDAASFSFHSFPTNSKTRARITTFTARHLIRHMVSVSIKHSLVYVHSISKNVFISAYIIQELFLNITFTKMCPGFRSANTVISCLFYSICKSKNRTWYKCAVHTPMKQTAGKVKIFCS